MSLIIRAHPYAWPVFQPASSHMWLPVGIQFLCNHDCEIAHPLSEPSLLLSPKGLDLAQRPLEARVPGGALATFHMEQFDL